MKSRVIVAICTTIILLKLLWQVQCQLPQGVNIQVWKCESFNQKQKWMINEDSSVRSLSRRDWCLSWSNCDTWLCKITGNALFMYTCGAPLSDNPEPVVMPKLGDWQIWKRDTQTLQNGNSCLTAPSDLRANGGLVSMSPCASAERANQQWIYNVSDNTFRVAGNQEMCLDYGTYLKCDNPQLSSYPYCNPMLTATARAKDLLQRMTLPEKISQTMHNARAIPRLGVPYYGYWNSGDHGVANPFAVSTQFPQVIALGATFNQSMVFEVAKTISTEARAANNLERYGITYWSPNINIFRDPRWGRGQETPGEDPYLSSRYVTMYIKGLQEGSDNRCTKIAATCKHFAAYSLDHWKQYERHSFNAIVSEQDLEETYLPAFRACVQDGGAKAIMCSYNALNGVPTCASSLLLQTIARERWAFDGLVVSDCDSVEDILESHHYTNTTWEAASVAIKAGTDMDCGYFYQYLPDALKRNAISEDDINLATFRILKQRFELGMFDGPQYCAYQNIGPESIDTKESRELALNAARESIVLLKNIDNVLPFNLNKVRTIAVIGPNANDPATLQGNYYGKAPYVITPLQAFQELEQSGAKINYAKGSDVTGTNTSNIEQAASAAQASDVAVLFLGTNQTVAAEGTDLVSLELPDIQQKLLSAVISTGKPVVVVLISGGPLTLAKFDDKIQGLVQAWYGGQSAGTAIVDVLVGRYNPGGVLPVTFYQPNYVNLIPMNDMSMTTYPGRTYRYLQVPPYYPFGFGLSYTKFQASVMVPRNQTVTSFRAETFQRMDVTVTVQNAGHLRGDYVALAFIKFDNSLGKNALKQQLFAFNRVNLVPQESASLRFELTRDALLRYNEKGIRGVYSGEYCIVIGVNHASSCFTLHK